MVKVVKAAPVVEIYGPVVQGEGEMIGCQTIFVRFGYCDYRCSWCDSMFAVDPGQVALGAIRMDAPSIVTAVLQLPKAPWITLSGGNPAMHLLQPLVDSLHNNKYKVAIETQGSIWKPWVATCDCITVSPKPPSSGMARKDPDFETLTHFLSQAPVSTTNLKIVVFDDMDFLFAKQVHHLFPQYPMTVQVGNDVGHDGAEALLAKLLWLTEKCLQDPDMAAVKPLPQLHTLLYGNMRAK
jgi:7-carboxy-7-deazaguanine synthase